MDSSGTPIDRWVGYRGAGDWLRTFGQAISDPTTAEAKEQKFKVAPTEALAAALGRIHASRGLEKDSIGYYREAERLAGGPKAEYASAIFLLQTRGLATGDPTDKLLVAESMADIATDRKEPGLFAAYLEPALEASRELTDEHATKLRADLEIAGALLVKKDKDLAVALKRKSMPDGWEADTSHLNEFAWWCYKHQLNLEEGERLARKGVELSKPGTERAQVLDTAAEICNLMGNCDDAVSLAEQAAKEDPQDEHYARQVKRFAELRDKKKAEAGA